MTEPDPIVLDEQHPDEDAMVKHSHEKANDDLLSPEAREHLREVMGPDAQDEK